jgi:hypothetical protein
MAVESSKELASSDRHQQGGYEIRHNVAQLAKTVMSRWDRSYLDSYMAVGVASGNNTPNASPIRQQSGGETSLWSLAGQRTSSKMSAVNDVGVSGEGVESASGFYQKLVSLLVPSALLSRRNCAIPGMVADLEGRLTATAMLEDAPFISASSSSAASVISTTEMHNKDDNSTIAVESLVVALEEGAGEGDFELSMDLIFDDQATGLLRRFYEQLHMTVKQVVKETHAAKLAQ